MILNLYVKGKHEQLKVLEICLHFTHNEERSEHLNFIDIHAEKEAEKMTEDCTM